MFIADINELNLPKTCRMEFTDPDDLLNFKLIIEPDEVSSSFIFYSSVNEKTKVGGVRYETRCRGALISQLLGFFSLRNAQTIEPTAAWAQFPTLVRTPSTRSHN